MKWNKLTTRNIAEDEKDFLMVALNLFGKAKLQKLTRKFLYTIQKHKIYTPISGSIMEKELVLRTLMKTQYFG